MVGRDSGRLPPSLELFLGIHARMEYTQHCDVILKRPIDHYKGKTSNWQLPYQSQYFGCSVGKPDDLLETIVHLIDESIGRLRSPYQRAAAFRSATASSDTRNGVIHAQLCAPW